MTENALKLIEYTYQQIYLCCQDSLYYPPSENQKLSQHIISAATYILNDATSIIREGLMYGPQTNLSLNHLQKLLEKILIILRELDCISEKERKIKELMMEEKLKPSALLTTPDWTGNFMEKVEY